VRWGREKKSRAIEEEDRKVTAYHEAGHAIVSCKTPDQDPVHKVTIVSRGRALGATMSLPEKDDYNHWRRKLAGRIAVCFGGRLAEEIVFGDISAGAQNDIEQATNLAKVMVCELGMSQKAGPVKYTTDEENPFLGREFHLASGLSEKTLELINEEVRRLIEEQYETARRILTENRVALDRVAPGTAEVRDPERGRSAGDPARRRHRRVPRRAAAPAGAERPPQAHRAGDAHRARDRAAD
jgi:cell division protease FtsH